MKNVPVSQFGTFQEENLIFSGRSQTLRLQREENSVLSFRLLPRATHTVSEALSSAQPCSPPVPSLCASQEAWLVSCHNGR